MLLVVLDHVLQMSDGLFVAFNQEFFEFCALINLFYIWLDEVVTCVALSEKQN